MKKLTLSVLGFTLVIILSLAGLLQAAPRYYFQDLGILPGGNSSGAYGLNHAGQVVGDGQPQSLWWWNARFLEKPRPAHPGFGHHGGGT